MDTRYVAKGMNVACRTIEGQAFILDQNGGLLLKLDEIGSFIWDQIYEVKTIKQISEICCQLFAGDKDEICLSIREFIDDLHEKNLLILSSEPFPEEVTSAC